MDKVLKVLMSILLFPITIYKFYKSLPHRRQKMFWGIVFLIPWIIGFSVFFAYPLIRSLWWSFNFVSPAQHGGLDIKFAGLGRYIAAFTTETYGDQILIQILWDTMAETLLNLPTILIFSLLIAVILNTDFKGRAIARAIFFIPVIFNSAAIEVALGGGEAMRDYLNQSGQDPDMLFQSFQLQEFLLQAGFGEWFITFITDVVNRIYIIISFSGVQILIFLAGIQSIPGHLYEAAKIEGATGYEIFWKITLPMVSPLIVTATVYTVIDSFVNSPITRIIDSFRNSQEFGMASALSWIYFGANVIILAVAVILAKIGVFYYDE